MGDTSLVFNLVARDRASGEVSAMGERMNTAAAGIGTGIGAALGVGAVASLDMEATNAKLAAQLGLNEAEAARVGEVSGNVFSAGFGQSVDEVNLALGSVVSSMGKVGDFTDAELQDMTKKAMVLADVFEFDVGEASTAAGQLIKTGLAENGAEAFDLLTAGAQALPKAMQGDLPSVVSEYSTQFRRLGLDGQTAMALLGQGAQAGARDVDQVADAIGQFGELTLAGGEAAKTAFTSIGLNAGDMAKKIGAGGDTAEQALQQTLDALRGTSNEQVKLNAATALFGDPGTVMGDALFALDPAGAAAATGLDKAAGSTQGLVDKTSGTATSALNEFKNTALTKLAAVSGALIGFGMDNKGATLGLVSALGAVAGIVLLVSAAQKVYATYTAIATVATNVMNSATYRAIAGWTRMMAVGLMTYARIAGAAVVSATTTAAAWVGSALVSIGTWIAAVVRAGLTAAAQFVMMAARAVAWAAVMAAQWLIAMGPIGWIIAAVVAMVALIVLNWDKIKNATGAVWGWIWGKIKGIGAAILGYITNMPLVSYFLRHWDRIKTGVASKAVGLIGFVRGLPGRIASAVGNLGSLLYNKGMNVVQGLWNGIKAMGGWLASRVAGFAKNSVTGAIKGALGINSPSTEMADQVGHWLPPGIAQGAEDNRAMLTRTMSSLVQAPSSTTVAGIGRSMAPALPGGAPGAGGGRTVLEIRSGGSKLDDLLVELLRKAVRTRGGDVQIVLGTG
ncbi:phage tail tape measure protein [Streptomyces scopuliridis]|uniref:phage tail tape measure protein n=1 Tax=Streptomyces scopuliridis TaxID=452529 RepID=UPI00369C245B